MVITVKTVVTVVVEGGRVLVIVVGEPDMLVVTVVVLAGNVEIKVKVVVVCEWSEAVVKKKRKTLQRSRVTL